MKDLLLTTNALDDLEFWAQSNLRTLKQIFKLFKDISKNLLTGLGKPES
jgi:Txe/YoeB family toxin of Txe-Axe toxin-antitoxin module